MNETGTPPEEALVAMQEKELKQEAQEAATDEDAVVVVDEEEEGQDELGQEQQQKEETLDVDQPQEAPEQSLFDNIQTPEDYVVQAQELAQLLQMERETQLAAYQELVVQSGGEKIPFEQVSDIITVLENMRDNVDEMNQLMENFPSDPNVTIAFGYISSQRADTLLLIDEILENVAEPAGLMAAESQSELGIILQAWAGEDVEKLAQAQRVQERLDKAAEYAGIGYDAFVKLNEGSSLDEFISFLIDPIGTSSTREFNFGSVSLGEREAGVVVLHQFKAKMKNSGEVAKAFSKAMQTEVFASWAATRLKQIQAAADDPQALKAVLVEFNKTVLEQDTSQDKVVLNAFSLEFTTALFGGEKDKIADEKSMNYFQDLLKDDGKKLDNLWNISSSK